MQQSIIILLLVLIGSALVGSLIGAVIGNIMYPNPDKASNFSKKGKIIIVICIVIGIALLVAAYFVKNSNTSAPEMSDSKYSENGYMSSGNVIYG